MSAQQISSPTPTLTITFSSPTSASSSHLSASSDSSSSSSSSSSSASSSLPCSASSSSCSSSTTSSAVSTPSSISNSTSSPVAARLTNGTHPTTSSIARSGSGSGRGLLNVSTSLLSSSAAVSSSSPDRSPAAPRTPVDILSIKDRVRWRQKGVLVLVGLPARGKSYIAYKIVSYMRWRGYKADLFNVGKYRRQQLAKTVPQSANFFAASNSTASQQREQLALAVLENLLDWLEREGDLAVFDATNTTRKRRQTVYEVCKQKNPQLNVVFIESVCNDIKVLESNYRAKAMNSPDYCNMPLEAALEDLRQRVTEYEKVYELMSEDHLPYLSLENLNSKIVCNKISGQMMHSITSYLMSIHIQPRPIYLVRAGHCDGENMPVHHHLDLSYNGDAVPISMSPSIGYATRQFNLPYVKTLSIGAHLDCYGQSFSDRLTNFISHRAYEYWSSHADTALGFLSSSAAAQTSFDEPPSPNPACSTSPTTSATDNTQFPSSSLPRVSFNLGDALPLVVYTSTLPRAIETAAKLSERATWAEAHSSLNMIDTGIYAGMTLEQMKLHHPDVIEQWSKDKFNYRFPGGESQRDKARSLVPLLIALESQRFPTVVVSHASTLQVLYGYFLGLSCPPSEYYTLTIPQHTVVELKPNQYGWEEVRYNLSTPADERVLNDADKYPAKASDSPLRSSDLSPQQSTSEPQHESVAAQPSCPTDSTQTQPTSDPASLTLPPPPSLTAPVTRQISDTAVLNAGVKQVRSISGQPILHGTRFYKDE